ncbi:MAG: 50S ribosomal protein L16 [Candidatus Falkowbacteria bacterium]|nr:50S ribosomal protein L16 [Candidatus Falkowbacteria bacterium]
MLMPKKTKYRKSHKGNRGGTAQRGNTVSFGGFGLMSLEEHWVTSRQIESARRVISRYSQRGGKIWIRIFPDKPVTKKGGEMPMGKGKGSVDHYVAVVKPGSILFERDGVLAKDAKIAMELASQKLPIKCKFVVKNLI